MAQPGRYSLHTPAGPESGCPELDIKKWLAMAVLAYQCEEEDTDGSLGLTGQLP